MLDTYQGECYKLREIHSKIADFFDMPRIIFFLIIFVCATAGSLKAEDSLNIPYKLAILHMQSLDPLNSYLGKTEEPSDALVAEMKWILDTLKHRCLNPEVAIADTIVETWTSMQQNGYEMSLLEVARELSKFSRNMVLFGKDKVNFRMTSRYWLLNKLYDKNVETITNE